MSKKKNDEHEKKNKSKETEKSEDAMKSSDTGEEQSNKETATENNINHKDNRIEQLEAEVADLKDRLMRKAADFENYKRRMDIEQGNLLRYGGEGLIMKLLPVIDDFERSLSHISEAKDTEAIKRGIQLIYDKLMQTLKDFGIEKIEANGKPFDVDFHEAVMQQPAENVEPFTVINEVETGYIFKDKVIRHTKVIVSGETEDKKES